MLLNNVHQDRRKATEGQGALRWRGVFRAADHTRAAVRKVRIQSVTAEVVIRNVRRYVERQGIATRAPGQPKAMHDDEGDQQTAAN